MKKSYDFYFSKKQFKNFVENEKPIYCTALEKYIDIEGRVTAFMPYTEVYPTGEEPGTSIGYLENANGLVYKSEVEYNDYVYLGTREIEEEKLYDKLDVIPAKMIDVIFTIDRFFECKSIQNQDDLEEVKRIVEARQLLNA